VELIPGEWLGFPYAIRVAQDRGATRIHIQPRLIDSVITGDVRPDVYGERPERIPLIVEIEHSTGQTFKRGGVREREAALIGQAEFVFILGPLAKGGCEKRLREWFGASVELLYLEDLVALYGSLGIESVEITLPNPAMEPSAPLVS